MNKILLILVSVIFLFSACEDEVKDSLVLKGTWSGKAQGETNLSYWTFKDGDTLFYKAANGSTSFAIYEYDDSKPPVTIKVKFKYHEDANSNLVGDEWWGLVEYLNGELTLGFKLPLGERSFPEDIDDPLRVKKFELKKQ